MTSKPTTGHECESWQMRRHPSGGRYCGACGRLAPAAPLPPPAPEEAPPWAAEEHRGTVTGVFPEAAQ